MGADLPRLPPTARVLKHELPDGSWHFDLLVAARPAEGPDDRCALAWRMSERPDQMSSGRAAACEALSAHRALYLALERKTDLSDNRGTVQPVAAGWVSDRGELQDSGVPARFTVRWAPGKTLTYRIAARGAGQCIECVDEQPNA